MFVGRCEIPCEEQGRFLRRFYDNVADGSRNLGPDVVAPVRTPRCLRHAQHAILETQQGYRRIGVVGLRLIRKNCSFCSQPYQPEAGLLSLLPREVLDTANFRRGTGCAECMNTGFSGRTAVTELLQVDEVLRDAILKKLPTRALQEVAIQQGMQTLWQMGLRRILKGETPLEEILRVVAVDYQN